MTPEAEVLEPKRPKARSAVDLAHEISELRSRTTALSAERDTFIAARARALTVEPQRYDQRRVDDLKAAIARLEGQISTLEERIAAIQKDLPTEKDVRVARAQATALLDAAQVERATFDETWKQFCEQTEATTVTALKVVSAAHAARTTNAKVAELNVRFGLSLAAQPPAAPSAREAEVMGLLGVIIKHVALNQETHELAERQLNALREKRTTLPDATPASV